MPFTSIVVFLFCDTAVYTRGTVRLPFVLTVVSAGMVHCDWYDRVVIIVLRTTIA